MPKASNLLYRLCFFTFNDIVEYLDHKFGMHCLAWGEFCRQSLLFICPTLYQMTIIYEAVTLSDNRKVCCRVCSWLVKDLLIMVTQSISVWNKHTLMSEGETNVTCTEFVFIDQLFSWYLMSNAVEKHIISMIPLLSWFTTTYFWFPPVFIDILQCFSFFLSISSLSLLRCIFYWYPSFRTLFPLLLKCEGVLYVMKT